MTVTSASDQQRGRPFQFNETFHALRDSELRNLPQGKIFLSAGCSGSWYFDWVERCCRPRRHIGVELYSPRPDGLPDNCTWIASSISSFPQVEPRSVDVVFSGQNIEHLWIEDIVGFLLESRRVLRDGGLLVIDTPNRDVTSPMYWCHPEHTAEFTVSELHRMVQLAGFTVVSTVGHWLCRDRDSGERLPLAPSDVISSEVAVATRVSGAYTRPIDAFSIWLTATATGTSDEDALQCYVADVWHAANAERLRRSTISADCVAEGNTFTTNGVVEGFLMWGPYVPLQAGHYRITWKFRLDRPLSGPVATVDITTAGGESTKARRSVDALELSVGQWTDVALDLILDETVFGLEFRVRGKSGAAFTARRHADVSMQGAS